jgi:hypothetical protein
MITLRFDMRAPATAAPTTELYAAAIEMCAWAETRGAILAVFSEHHGTEDGHPADENVGLLLRLLKGEPVVHEGRHIHVTPQCVTKRAAGGPYRVLTIDDGTAHVRGGRSLPLLRLRAGLSPDVAWPYPENAASAVARAHNPR